MSATPKAAGTEQKPMRRACLQKQLRKTKLCTYHLKGACQFGEECAFAHSSTEMEDVPDLRKTRLCKAFQEGTCTNPDCTFAHGENELRSTDMFFKKTLCFWNDKGRCRSGANCRFAHSLAELKAHASPEEVCQIVSANGPAGSDAGSSNDGSKTGRKQRRSKAATNEAAKDPQSSPTNSILKEKSSSGSNTPTSAVEPMKIYQANCADAALDAAPWKPQLEMKPGDFMQQLLLTQQLTQQAAMMGNSNVASMAEMQGVQMQATLETLKQNIMTLTAQWSTLQQVVQTTSGAYGTGNNGIPPVPSAAPAEELKRQVGGSALKSHHMPQMPPLFPDYNEPMYFMQQSAQEEPIMPPPGLADGVGADTAFVKGKMGNHMMTTEDLDYSFGWEYGPQAMGA
mmetsp:Transcript_67248/g.161175  ORF Transcript_67248/g.161175 Transcript_67248/m.161175 type:complete len:398 (-) Transcript_67248:231-1424(-)|eukprot:CAMPEP_0178439336 /NCGR_PEP_ID=MMETSP0689_2-20121128/36101_1 /TAXON_ID=160604 /ORGANISM="Amphidinium massartii, Strain CS-259" /LENGTH=397 /DNA_ID=CAMNT_0020061857 /DNA_START=43 /DNA_END=1236 /DNA_ORIENTATION=-